MPYTPLLQKLPIPAIFVGLDSVAKIVSEPAREMGYKEGVEVNFQWLKDFLTSGIADGQILVECQSKWWQVQMQRVEDGVIIVATDISGQVGIRQAIVSSGKEQASSSRQILRHDAVTFLNNIDNYLTMLLDEPENIHLIAKVQSSANKLRALLEDFAYLHGAGKSKPRLLVFREVVQHALDELCLIISKKQAIVSLEGNGTTVWGDATRLDRVVGNLIRNALHYQSTNSDHVPKVGISIFLDKKDERFVILEIEDNGIGIPLEYCESIFQPRTRLHSTQEYSGSGLGLAIVKQIVLEHDGSLGVVSEPGHGSKFWVRLPRSSEYLASRR